jgi:hypothetical protein
MTGGSPGPVIPLPPGVAASLAVHGCADAAITVRLTMPEETALACFGVSGPLAAGLIRSGDQVDVGLFPRSELVEQVVRLIPPAPPAPLEAAAGCVRITVHDADAAATGWQQILVSGESHWCRMQLGTEPNRLVTVSDVRRQLAADLRFALADRLGRAAAGRD